MKPRALLVANPNATRVTPRTRDLIARALSSVTELDVAWTEERGHATKLAAHAAEQGVEFVIALGGDGTVNECARGIVGTGTALAIVPSGGADVFARTLGTPRDSVEAADMLIERIEASSPIPTRGVGMIAVGKDEPRPFLFNAGIGFDAAIVAAVDRHSALKRRFGQAFFVFQAFLQFFRYPRRRASVTVTTDTVSVTGRLVIWCASNPYTYLGKRPFRLCPLADHTTGLDAFIVEDMTLLRTLRIIARGFGRARHDRLKGVTVLRGVHEATITTSEPLLAQADGEVMGRVSTAHVRWVPTSLLIR